MVHYRWHPRCQQPVYIWGKRQRPHALVYLCRQPDDEQRLQRGFEIPAWMCDAAKCAVMRLESAPRVHWPALSQLRDLFAVTKQVASLTPEVCEPDDPSRPVEGVLNGAGIESGRAGAIGPVSTTSTGAHLGRSPKGPSRENHEGAGNDVAQLPRSKGRDPR